MRRGPTEPIAGAARLAYGACGSPRAPVAQLDRALPSEGRGRTFESCRVRHPVYRHPAPPSRRMVTPCGHSTAFDASGPCGVSAGSGEVSEGQSNAYTPRHIGLTGFSGTNGTR